MLDIREIREDPDGVLTRLRRRDPSLDLSTVLSLDEERRGLVRKVEELRRRRKQGSEEVASLQAQGKTEEAQDRIASLRALSEELKALEDRLSQVEAALWAELLSLPNLPHDSVPLGTKEEKVLLRTWGQPQKFDFPPKHHVELGRKLGLLDFERAAKVTGARFPMYTGLGAMLELTLVHWMLELHVRQHGYIPVLPPILANRTSFLVSGQLPKFAGELYHCEEDDLFLNPTAES